MIEFLEPDRAGDPGEPSPATLRRHRLVPWLVLAAALVLAGVFSAALDRRPGPANRNSSSRSSPIAFQDPATLLRTYPGVRVPRAAGSLGELRGVPGLPAAADRGGTIPCPPQQACILDRAVPVSVRAVIRRLLPGFAIRDVIDVRAQRDGYGPVLWFRQVQAKRDGTQLTVRVLAPSEQGAAYAGTARFGTATATYVVVPADALAVVVYESGSNRDSTRALTRLARDPRLISS